MMQEPARAFTGVEKAAVLMMLSMRLVMWAAPSPPRERFRLLTRGAVTAAALWLTASAGYGFYVGELSSYNATYGAFAALVILLLWIWLTSMAFLFGCELDAVLFEEREGYLLRGDAATLAGISAAGREALSRHPAAEREPPPAEQDRPPPKRTRAEDR